MSFNELKKLLQRTGYEPLGLLIKSGDIRQPTLSKVQQKQEVKPVS